MQIYKQIPTKNKLKLIKLRLFPTSENKLNFKCVTFNFLLLSMKNFLF